MSKHTPGPWKDLGRIWGDGIEVASAKLVDRPGATDAERVAETKANARLIAAAPELLEACEQALKLLEIADSEYHRESDTTKLVRAVIAKARGTNA